MVLTSIAIYTELTTITTNDNESTTTVIGVPSDGIPSTVKYENLHY